MIVGSGVPGPNTCFTPDLIKSLWSISGMTPPPTIRTSLIPFFFISETFYFKYFSLNIVSNHYFTSFFRSLTCWSKIILKIPSDSRSLSLSSLKSTSSDKNPIRTSELHFIHFFIEPPHKPITSQSPRSILGLELCPQLGHF